MNDRTLFDVGRITSARCPVCGDIREPLQDKAQNCAYDRSSMIEREGPRPKGCLNAHNPAHAPFPEGY